MRRLYAWLAGGAGALAAYRALGRRRATPELVPETGPDPRADELRARLEGARETEPEPEPDVEPADPEERRRLVHEQARAALEDMRGGVE
jgi:hypothetical protein